MAIQIHLMLLFIMWLPLQTGSVSGIQIHLMLLFILWVIQDVLQSQLFKYISCYCLSHRVPAFPAACTIQIHLMLLFIDRKYYKRYDQFVIQIHLMLLFIHKTLFYLGQCQTFKYISCYCLSITALMSLSFVTLFKYISCYCLSVARYYWQDKEYNSNTSHVIVYHRPNYRKRSGMRIQIHLMLLFI